MDTGGFGTSLLNGIAIKKSMYGAELMQGRVSFMAAQHLRKAEGIILVNCAMLAS